MQKAVLSEDNGTELDCEGCGGRCSAQASGAEDRHVCVDDCVWVRHSSPEYVVKSSSLIYEPTSRRFDFMGHMAFTHDFGMLKSGQDGQRLVQLIEHALMSVSYHAS